MNRIIKFRLWTPSVNQMTVDGQDLKGYIFTIPPNATKMREEWDELVWMQFTGLLDKNGKEIYEGDVVQFGSVVGPVGFEGGKFVVAYKMKMEGKCDVPSLCEVIGNIYENPNLLI